MNSRRANTEDLNQLVKIRLEFLKEDFTQMTAEQANTIEQQLSSYFTQHLEQDFFAYIAEEEGEIIASIFLLIIEKPANPNFITGKIGSIHNVYTAPSFRRQGIAARLMESLLAEVKTMELSYIELKATECGYPLYKKFGFVEEKSDCTAMKLVTL